MPSGGPAAGSSAFMQVPFPGSAGSKPGGLSGRASCITPNMLNT